MTPAARSFTLTSQQQEIVLASIFEALRDRMERADELLEDLLIEPLAQPRGDDLNVHLRDVQRAIEALRVLGWPVEHGHGPEGRANASQEDR